MRSYCVAVVCAFLAVPAFSAPPEAPPRIAVIRLPEAIATTQEAKKGVAELNDLIAKRREEFRKQQEQIEELKKRLADGDGLLNAVAIQDLRLEIGRKSTLLQRGLEDLRSDSQEREAKLAREIGSRMLAVIADYARKNNFALVLNATGSITWASAVVNITDRIVRQYDLAYPVQPEPAVPAARPGT